MAQLSEQELVRREKLSKLRELGIDPYPAELYPLRNIQKRLNQTLQRRKSNYSWTIDA